MLQVRIDKERNCIVIELPINCRSIEKGAKTVIASTNGSTESEALFLNRPISVDATAFFRPGLPRLGKPGALAQDSEEELSENEDFEYSAEAIEDDPQYREILDGGTSYEQVIDEALWIAPELVGHVDAVLQKMPKRRIRKLIQRQARIFAPNRLFGQCLDLRADDEGIVLVYLSPDLANNPTDRVRYTIAHEFAHVVLDHSEDPCPDAATVGETNERKADELAAQWGFPRPAD
jgi:hypothetical protein